MHQTYYLKCSGGAATLKKIPPPPKPTPKQKRTQRTHSSCSTAAETLQWSIFLFPNFQTKFHGLFLCAWCEWVLSRWITAGQARSGRGDTALGSCFPFSSCQSHDGLLAFLNNIRELVSWSGVVLLWTWPFATSTGYCSLFSVSVVCISAELLLWDEHCFF